MIPSGPRSRPRSFGSLLAQLGAVLVVVLAFPAVSHAAETGVVPELSWGISSNDQDRSAAAMDDLNVQWARINMSWGSVETRKGSYSKSVLDHYDRAVQLARAAGAKVIVMVDRAPSWASGSSDRGAPPKDPADYANFMGFIAARYANQAAAFEIWNEQNTWRFWSTGPNPAEYARLLKAAYPAVKSSAPNAKVVFGGLAFNSYRYLEQAYAAEPNLGSYFDVMATHPYTTGAGPESVQRGSDGRISSYSFAGYREVRASMQARGDHKPIWFTEFGWATTSAAWGVSEAAQADYLVRAYRCVEQDPYVEVALWYNLRNNYWAKDADNWNDQLGLLWSDYSPKPSYSAFKGYAPGAGGCNYGGVGAPGLSGASDSADVAPAAVRRLRTMKRTRTTIRVRRAARARSSSGLASSTRRGRRVRVFGRVATVARGRVVLRIERRVGMRKWRRVATRRIRVDGSGRYRRLLRVIRRGRLRVRATYLGAPGFARSRSRLAYFRV